MRKLMTIAAGLVAGAAPMAANAATVIYSNNFNVASGVTDFNTTGVTSGGVSAVISGAASVGTVSNTSYGFGGSFVRNDSTGNPATPTVFTLSNLPTHTSVSIATLFAFLDSWDSIEGPDYVAFTIDGSPILSGLTANNASGSTNVFGAGSTVLGQYVQMDSSTYFSDTVIDMANTSAFTFAHTGSTLTFSVYAYGSGWQGSSDEAFGLDNLQISVDGTSPVPEPASWAMMVGGFGLLGGAMRQRRRTTVTFA